MPDVAEASHPWPWCVLTFDNRPAHIRFVYSYWTRAARINQFYAQLHSYGYRHSQLTDSKCSHATQGVRAPAWCKLPAIAHALLDGIDGRACTRLFYVDSDAIVAEPSLTLDMYLARARASGDEALLEASPPAWEILFASNYWFSSGLNSGVMWVNGSSAACGILRAWWDVRRCQHASNREWGEPP